EGGGKAAPRKSDKVFTAVAPAAPHQRFWAKGRSMLIVHTSTPPGSLPASVLKRRVPVSHPGVSSEGTALRMTTLPLASLSFTGARALSTAVKSGAAWPALISGPTSVPGFPRSVTALALVSGITNLLVGWTVVRKGSAQDAERRRASEARSAASRPVSAPE